jgi:O-antigen/teichoic acid export membrane protein
VAQAAAFAGAGAAAGMTFPVAAGLVLADIVSRVATSAVLLRHIRRGLHLGPLRRIWGGAKGFAHSHRSYPLLVVPSGLLNTVGVAATPVLMFATFDVETAGQYSLVERVILLPAGLVAQAITQVFTGRFAQILRTEPASATREYLSLITTLALVALVPALLLFMLGPSVFGWVFGSNWQVAGEFARILSLHMLISFVAAPVNLVLTLGGRKHYQLYWDIGRLAGLGLGWFWIVSTSADAPTAVAIHVGVNVVAQLAMLGLAYHACRGLAHGQ